MMLPKRGERMARWMIDKLDQAGVAVEAVKCPDGWALKFPGPENHTSEQRELAVDAAMLGIGYPRNFATMCRLLQNREAHGLSSVVPQ